MDPKTKGEAESGRDLYHGQWIVDRKGDAKASMAPNQDTS